jgi:squamous cell carcinoma antigen recognized by T-cells 3
VLTRILQDSVPAALTKDKKRIRGAEINVHLAWKSTLYVTNFPAKMDNAGIKDLFGKVCTVIPPNFTLTRWLQYGTLFDVRWPSKKFKSTRRFCYVQFTSPVSRFASCSSVHILIAGL